MEYFPGRILWIPAAYSLASHPLPLKNQIRVETLREGRRGDDSIPLRRYSCVYETGMPTGEEIRFHI
jgi:hypothetical protein